MEYNNIVIKNIYYMLSYAFRVLQRDEFTSMETEEFENIHDLFAAILALGIGRQLKQGLYREYQDVQENLPTIRGKIHLLQSMRNHIVRKQLMCCEFDELTENNEFNQIIKCTAMLLMSHPKVRKDRQNQLKRQLLFFTTIDRIDLLSVDWNRLIFHRNNETYRLLLGICELVVKGMLLSTEKGAHRLASFVNERELSNLYERFILAYYQQEHPYLKPRASQIQWDIQNDNYQYLPIMQTDSTLTYQNKTLIIDAKFYSSTLQRYYQSQTIHSDNLYQIYAYVKNRAATRPNEEVSGLLLYARTTDALQPDISYQMGDNTISVKTLDLHRDFIHIANQLDEIVESLTLSKINSISCGIGR